MTVKQAVDARRSTRYYDTARQISSEDMSVILDAGRKAPNGLALEPWKFIVLSGDMSKLTNATYNQEHVLSADKVVVFVNYKQEYIDSKPEIITDLLVRKGLGQDKANKYLAGLASKGTQYCREQLMFAASQMVLQAAGLGIGSVVIGGFDPQQVATLIDLDTTKYEVGLLVDFGYAIEGEVKPRIIRDIDEVVSYIEL